jgi:hypothetical protein
MRKILWLVPLVVLSFGCSSAPPPPPFKPLPDTLLLMEAVVEPPADRVWDAVGWIVTAEGEQLVQPKTDEEWMAVRYEALALSQSGNLLMMPPHAKDEEWIRLSQALVDVAAEAARAAETKNLEEFFRIGGDIYAVCTNCHAKYAQAIVRPGE